MRNKLDGMKAEKEQLVTMNSALLELMRTLRLKNSSFLEAMQVEKDTVMEDDNFNGGPEPDAKQHVNDDGAGQTAQLHDCNSSGMSTSDAESPEDSDLVIVEKSNH